MSQSHGNLLLLLLSARSRSQQSVAAKLGLLIHHQKPECPVKKIGLLHSGSRSQQRTKMLMLVQISYKPPNIFFSKTWYCDASLWVRVSCKIFDLLFSRSGSFQELIWSKYDNFYCLFWTADPFATKFDFILPLAHWRLCMCTVSFDCNMLVFLTQKLLPVDRWGIHCGGGHGSVMWCATSLLQSENNCGQCEHPQLHPQVISGPISVQQKIVISVIVMVLMFFHGD